MAGILLAANASGALTAATAKTIVQIVAPTHQRLRIKRYGVSFDGSVSSAAPARVRVLRQTTAGTSSSLTPTKLDPNGTETIQSTALQTITAEPTAGDVLKDFMVPVYQGLYEVTELLEAPIEMAGGTRLGIEVTAPASVTTCRAFIHYEE
jgi:hypothetical protein